MKLTHSLMLAMMTLGFALHAHAQPAPHEKGATFQFSTQVSRTVEKDLMTAEVFSRKAGKKLPELKKAVSANLNKVLEQAKQNADIELIAEGISNYADYDQKGKVIGWVAEGRVRLISKNFDAIANILDHLDEEIAITAVDFSVSPEKAAALEDEMTLEIIKQFQHKAEIIQKGLNAQKYTLTEVQLNTPNGYAPHDESRMYALSSAKMATENKLPLEAGKQLINATASGKVVFK
ncbi:hypothetical protein F480_07935 [Bibersteinia trehalosi Y31]|uniref:Periplasmic/secreted protein n=1 Tax=Bibersteinia trehalosi Y31 TaxID=1261658 RepID=A0A179CXQ6_BIBTR|nr:SIMPL domain-containing protein [Bibersteinia trehalosi]OAQ14298.1 hypothetical protein F480_07935 [Bibersteinia trehalosi Y31]